MKSHSAKNMWANFLKTHLEYTIGHTPKVVQFCDNKKDANACAKLITKGIKKAISHSLFGIQLRKESLPKIGEFFSGYGLEWKSKMHY